MDNQKRENAIAAVRVSSVKQGLEGDSPEAQKEQIERFAQNHNINIKKVFVFIESASKQEQPVQEAIDYCKNPKNGIQLFVIKSIDRFTRGGSYLYDHLKMQLTRYGVKLVDIYGVIRTQEINTLEHLGVNYSWSTYSPTKKSEILEAERAKDELRDIMSRMIGAEIRYMRLGYSVKKAAFGYINEKVETPHGKRCILKPHPEESQWILKMFDLRIQSTMSDQEIVDELNRLGFKSRTYLLRDKNDRTRILGQRGGNKLKLKQFYKHIYNPVYAGINLGIWTQNIPIKGKFEGLVSIETFNMANKGKRIIIEDEKGEIKLYKDKPLEWRLRKQVNNPNYPFKRYILCTVCRKPLLGSASRGKLGKYYPAYHCNRPGHFRVSLIDFSKTLVKFMSRLRFTNEGVDLFKKAVLAEWDRRVASGQKNATTLQEKLNELLSQQRLITEKRKIVSSEVAIKFLEEDLTKLEEEITRLKAEIQNENKNEVDMDQVLDVTGYYLEHLEELVLGASDPHKRAAYFGLIFDKAPTYLDLISGTPTLAPHIELIDDMTKAKNLLVGPLSRGWNTIFTDILDLFEKLKALGFTYYNGRVAIIEILEEPAHV